MIYLLDTNILIAYVRGENAIRNFVDENYAPLSVGNEAVISVVSVGEIKSIAIQNSWGQKRITQLEEILAQIIVADINSLDIINRYAEIDAFSQGRLDGRKLNLSSRNMGKNDLWIAATASVVDAMFLTTDGDFDHLDKEFLKVARIGLINE